MSAETGSGPKGPEMAERSNRRTGGVDVAARETEEAGKTGEGKTPQEDERDPRTRSTYDVTQEARIYALWEEGGYFAPHPARRTGSVEDRSVFSVVMPPPNVTGVLHSGHAMDNQIPDVLVRFHRMRGDEVVWVPGMDHAGIATHARVEALLRSEGRSRLEIGRERFLERAWAFALDHRETIRSQLRLLGVSADWQREAFTLDDTRARAVREAFVRLYQDGLIYRSRAIIQWCPQCRTALSDVEVEREDQEGFLWHFAYPLVDSERFPGGADSLTVATTRPETLFGDVAVAVHPDDERYRDLVGRHLVHPLTGRVMPVVADLAVEPEFGTGAVKITPDHDLTDFEIATRHGLRGIRVIDEDGHLTQAAGTFAGMDRSEARAAVVAEMERRHLLRRTEQHVSSVGHCSRCHTVVEPLASPQWFVRMRPLVEPVLRALDEGELRIHPDHFEKVLRSWIESIRDWTVSRQLWWGHPIPAFYSACGAVIVSRETPEACPVCGEHNLTPDPDVLDTWFSSGLWPFAVFDWPERTAELARYYPTSVLATGYDLLLFWILRMAVLGMHFLGEVPFRDVLFHGLLRDELGRKVSKSLENGVDVAEVIRTHGSDALRYAVTFGVTPGNDIRYREDRTLAGRNLANKIWNAVRFAGEHLQAAVSEGVEMSVEAAPGVDHCLADRWILSRLEGARAEIERSLLALEVGEALRLTQDVFWDEVCDWYLEMAKPRLRGEEGDEARREAQVALNHVIERSLRLLHPFLPFVTEAAWQRLPGRRGALMGETWPVFPEARDEEAERLVEPVLETVRRVRNVRREFRLPPTLPLALTVVPSDAGAGAGFVALRSTLLHLARLSAFDTAKAGEARPRGSVAESAVGVALFVHVGDVVDLPKEIVRMEAEVRSLEGEAAKIALRLENAGFLAKAPPEVVERDRVREEDLRARAELLRERLRDLGDEADVRGEDEEGDEGEALRSPDA